MRIFGVHFWVKKLVGANFYAFCNYGRMGLWDCGRTKSVEQGKQVTTDAPTDFLPLVRIRCKINGGMGILRIRVEWEIPGIKCGGNENSSESGNDGDLDKRQRWSGQI